MIDKCVITIFFDGDDVMIFSDLPEQVQNAVFKAILDKRNEEANEQGKEE